MIGAKAVIESILREDTEYIFGYPGGAIMPIYDELYSYQNKVKHILTRHEQGATHAAQGYARATGKVGVVFATSGPGATNLVTGIADALLDSTPLVCITGQVSSTLLGSDAFQEIDIVSITNPITKWNCQVKRAEDIPKTIAKAFCIAKSGRPGPVLIDITKDAQFGEFDFSYEKCEHIRSFRPVPRVDPKQVEAAAELINQAKKPFLVYGQGVILGEAEEELKAVVEKAGLPCAATILGLSALKTTHPLHKGMVGMHGNYAPNVLTNQCDVLIAVGMRFDDRVTSALDTYARQAKVVHFEIDTSEINKNVKADIPVLGNAKESLSLLLEKLKPNSHKEWENQFDELAKIEEEKIIRKELASKEETLTMGEVIEKINQKTNGDAILVSDVGQHQMMACRYGKFNNTRSKITSGGLGTMGFALPAAIGAKLGKPQKEVIAIIGDGGFQMTIQELGTIFQTKVPVKIVVLNNHFLGMVRQWQQMFFDKRYSSTEMTNPDFTKIVEGYNIKNKKVTHRAELDTAVEQMINSKESFFLEVCVGRENNVFPMIPTGASVSDIQLS